MYIRPKLPIKVNGEIMEAGVPCEVEDGRAGRLIRNGKADPCEVTIDLGKLAGDESIVTTIEQITKPKTSKRKSKKGKVENADSSDS